MSTSKSITQKSITPKRSFSPLLRWWKRLRRQPFRVGLALSGGGVRGLAHIGVLKVLERAGVPIDIITGTSAGGMIGATYAAGLTATQIEQEFLRMCTPRQLLNLMDRTIARRGLFEGQRLMEHLEQWLGDQSIEQLPIPFAAVAVDLYASQKVVIQDGPLLNAIRATIALPAVFSPVEKNGQLLVDGGLLDNLPVDVTRQMGADIVIAVDISTDRESASHQIQEMTRHRLLPNRVVEMIDVLWRAVDVMADEVNRRVLEEFPPDVMIRPEIPVGVTVLSGFALAADTIAAGERAALEALPHIQSLLPPSLRAGLHPVELDEPTNEEGLPTEPGEEIAEQVK